MRVIRTRRLEAFPESRKEDSQIALRDFSAWYKVAKSADWCGFGAIKQMFGTADQVGNCAVFDVGNNRLRLIARVNYARGFVIVEKPMDRAEYDKKLWFESCRCHKPPPKRPPAGFETYEAEHVLIPDASGDSPIASGNGPRYHESRRGCPRPRCGFAQRLRRWNSISRGWTSTRSSRGRGRRSG